MLRNFGKYIAFIVLAVSGVFTTSQQAMAFSDSMFQIQSTTSPTQVIDQFGDNFTRDTTVAHMFNKSQTTKTSRLRRKSYGSGGSSEIALADDMNVCMSALTGLNQNAIVAGTPVIFKRDCANSNNFLYIGDTIRPSRNSKFCVDAPNANFGNFSKLQLFPCNGSSAQSFKIVPIGDKPQWSDGTCYRKPNLGAIQYPCNFTSVTELSLIAHKSGPGFTVYYTTPDNRSNVFLGHIGPGGNPLRFPNGITKYNINVWNEGQTSTFSVERK
jgi:hypothetical protein